MQNVNLQTHAEALRALRLLDRHKVAVSWVGGKVEFRSEAAPPDDIIALLDRHEAAIVKLMRRNGDGRSLPDLARERHRPLLEAVEGQRPPDVTDNQWREATDGLWVFVAAGHGAEAERLGWPRGELFDVPPLWSRLDLCGCALLIGDREVVNVSSTEIRIKTASGATLAFYRKPAVDYGLVYRERLKLLGGDANKEEPRLRAVEYVVNFYRSHHHCSLEDAKAAVMVALKAAP
jgi:hypothetical protein